MYNKNNKVIVVLGPTASGKTKLGVDLAYKFNGEIINADSRQVYKKMDIGTGKDLKEYRLEKKSKNGEKHIINIPYHLIDIVHPNTHFNLSKYQKAAYKKIAEVLAKGKVPILVGGSGLYLQAVVEGFNLSHTPPDPEKRKELEEMDETELFSKLEGINPVFAGRIKDSDRKNKRRLVRYIEICREQAEEGIRKQKTPYSFLLIGVSMEKNVLDQKIYKRLLERVEKEGMIQEVSGLHKNEGVSWKRLKQFGLEYRYIAEYLQEELGYEEMIEKLYTAIKRFSRRQMTWFRRWERQGADICWVTKNKEAQRISKNFLE